MLTILTVNGRDVVLFVAGGFNAEKFNRVRSDVLCAAFYWNGVLREAKKDIELVAGLVNKYQGIANNFTGEVKFLTSVLKKCWESTKTFEDTQHPSRLMMTSVFDNIEAVFKNHFDDFNIGNNTVMLDQLFKGGAFRSINLSVELTTEEEEEFGISKWKLIALRFKTGIDITKVRKGNNYVYSLNLDILCPGINFAILLYGHPELLNIIAPIVACYIKDFEEAVGSFLKSWDSVTNLLKKLPVSEAE